MGRAVRRAFGAVEWGAPDALASAFDAADDYGDDSLGCTVSGSDDAACPPAGEPPHPGEEAAILARLDRRLAATRAAATPRPTHLPAACLEPARRLHDLVGGGPPTGTASSTGAADTNDEAALVLAQIASSDALLGGNASGEGDNAGSGTRKDPGDVLPAALWAPVPVAPFATLHREVAHFLRGPTAPLPLCSAVRALLRSGRSTSGEDGITTAEAAVEWPAEAGGEGSARRSNRLPANTPPSLARVLTLLVARQHVSS